MEADLLKLYYSAETGLTSVDKLYARLKALKIPITKPQLRAFISKQEVHQTFLRRRVKRYFPLLSYHPFSRLQIDLADVSQLSHWNGGIKYLFCAVDVFTRFAFVIPLKSKSDTEVLKAFKTIVDEIVELRGFPPVQLDSDQEPSFLSRAFKAYCEDNLIFQKLLPLEDYKGTAMVERFIRTMRELLNRYLVAYSTKTYKDVLPQLVANYNTRLHEGIKTTPTLALEEEFERRYWELASRRIAKAQGEASSKDYSEFNVGDRVRVVLRRKTFDKGTAQKWSSTIHTVKSFEDGLYLVSDRVNGYKPYELLHVGAVESLPVDPEAVASLAQEAEQVQAQRRQTRALRKEGIDVSDVSEAAPHSKTPAPRALRERNAGDGKYEIEKVLDFKFKDGQSKFQVKWKGWTQPTWEPAGTIEEDAPEAVDAYLQGRSGSRKGK